MMDIYYSLKVESTDEVLMALLTQFDFESFEENEDHFIGYIKKDHLDETLKIEVADIVRKFTDRFTFEEIAPQNWNEIWEASFQPVIVGDFCQIRADFHPASLNIEHDLVINPKMAFGTGHHATTHMMIDQMSDIDFKGKSVFDFGCGTGILAILAAKLGAAEIDAIDIEHESYANTIENATINHVELIHAYEGDIQQAPDRTYHIILANINRNILVKYADQLSVKLMSDGIILISGVLIDDQNIVIKAFEDAGLHLRTVTDKDGWICAKFIK